MRTIGSSRRPSAATMLLPPPRMRKERPRARRSPIARTSASTSPGSTTSQATPPTWAVSAFLSSSNGRLPELQAQLLGQVVDVAGAHQHHEVPGAGDLAHGSEDVGESMGVDRRASARADGQEQLLGLLLDPLPR